MDKELEAAIDEVGRDKVFAHARALGWGSTKTPPKHVWWGIIHQIRKGDSVPVSYSPPASTGLWQSLFGG